MVISAERLPRFK